MNIWNYKKKELNKYFYLETINIFIQKQLGIGSIEDQNKKTFKII